MKIVVAMDSFKGCLTSEEANQAAAEGIRRVSPDADIVQVPVSDGGEGFLQAFHAAIGGEWQGVTVRDPLMRPVTAHYLLVDKFAHTRPEVKVAVIEMAQASGLTLLTKEERNPMVTTSYGTGQLVADAVRKGAEHVIIGLGGSATSDAGIGMLRALIESLSPAPSHSGGVRCWDDIKEIRNVRFTIACDVRNPLCGETGAAYVFAPQKFSSVNVVTEEMLRHLDERARKFAEVSARHFGYDRSQMEGAGAAGGLGYAFLQYMNADCKPGIQLLFETVKFNEIVKDADLIITGEGSADRQTLMGKLPMGVLQWAGDVPVCLMAGRISDRELLLQAGFAHVACINQGHSLEEAMRKEVAIQNISDTVGRLLIP